MKSHKENFCGGNFKDWLEVMLTPKCNGICSWCIEKKGYHPKGHVDVLDLATQINSSSYKNIILLGGEPTLYKQFAYLCILISDKKRVYVTSNGQNLKILNTKYIHGVNLSIHHYDLSKNKEITGIDIDETKLKDFIEEFRGKTIRLNCNIIKGYIDNKHELLKYVEWAKSLGVKNVRFAELKTNGVFISLNKVLENKYGLNENPFAKGCNKKTVIFGVNIGFRQMCGLNTCSRPIPKNPEVDCSKEVLYYDGIFYNGWQQKEEAMGVDGKTKIELKNMVRKLKKKVRRLETKLADEERVSRSESSFCQY